MNKGMELFKQIMKAKNDHIKSSDRLLALYRSKINILKQQNTAYLEAGKRVLKQRDQVIQERDRYKAELRKIRDLFNGNNANMVENNGSAVIIDDTTDNTNEMRIKPMLLRMTHLGMRMKRIMHTIQWKKRMVIWIIHKIQCNKRLIRIIDHCRGTEYGGNH
eukprot:442309_1